MTGRFALRLIVGCVLPVAACGRPASPDVLVGDGVPRQTQKFVTVIRDELSKIPGNTLRVVPWNDLVPDSVGSDVAQAERFSAMPGMVAIVGHAGSKNTLLAAPVYRDAGIPIIVPTATASQLRSAGPLVFLLAPSNAAEGAFLADRALDSGRAARVAVMFVADPYGTGIRDGVEARLRARGQALVGEAAMSGQECLRNDLPVVRGVTRALIQRARPDAIILALPQSLSVCAVKEVVAALPSIRILAADSFDPFGGRIRDLSPAERRAVQYVAFWSPEDDSLSRAFTARTRERLGHDPGAGDALTYDAFMLVATAVQEAGPTRAAVAEWLRALGTPAHPPFAGVTGPIDFQRPRTALFHLRALADSGVQP